MKLYWDDCSTNHGYERRVEYNGLVIRAVQDDSPEMPWESWEGEPPLVYYSDGLAEHDSPYNIQAPLANMSDGFVIRHQERIAAALDMQDAWKAEAREYQSGHWGGRLVDCKRQLFEERLQDMKPSGSRSWSAACDYFEALETLWLMQGVAALDFQRNGYSQGDSIRGLLVATPVWLKAMGLKRIESLEPAADLLGSWAFGDVYGYIIETESGDHLDSCFGYYGELDKSGLEESALSAANHILEKSRKAGQEKLKELIRNRVPLAMRPAILAEARSPSHV